MYAYNSSNARKLNYDEPLHYNAVRRTTNKKQKTKVVSIKPDVSRKNSSSFTAKSFFAVAMAFLVAFFVVRGYVSINEAENRITALKTELRMVEAENQAIKAQIDKSVDLKSLQSIANEKFGMVRPENYQIFYMDLDFEDYTERIENKKEKAKNKDIPVESVTGVLISSADMFR